jgi:hypothetical protein
MRGALFGILLAPLQHMRADNVFASYFFEILVAERVIIPIAHVFPEGGQSKSTSWCTTYGGSV